MSEPVVLALETSCDETAAAVVASGTRVVASVVSSQVDLHARYGGVVPEIAGRAHLERLLPVLSETLRAADVSRDGSGGCALHLEAVAATTGPGLVGSLLVGVAAAKSLAMAWGVPFVAVNHLEGHLYAALLEDPAIEFPVIVLLVSGGHTLLIDMAGPGHYEVLGQTLDDAAGEAFDKVARYLGLGYPGGPALEAAARGGDPTALELPRAMLNEGFAFSFSGLKTAVVRHVERHPETDTADLAASFQEAVVDVLVTKALAAASARGARGICLAGGVAANTHLREALAAACTERGLHPFVPTRSMCTDNAAMIAAAGHFRLRRDGASGLDTGADPNLAFPARA